MSGCTDLFTCEVSLMAMKEGLLGCQMGAKDYPITVQIANRGPDVIDPHETWGSFFVEPGQVMEVCVLDGWFILTYDELRQVAEGE